MAYEFKKLSDVTLLDSVPQGATVLVEVDGVINRVPGDGLGGDGQVNRLGGYWFDGVTLEWDGSREGRETITLSDDNFTLTYAKISDEPIPVTLPTEVTMPQTKISSDKSETSDTISNVVEGILDEASGVGVFAEACMIVYTDTDLETGENTTEHLTKGVWFTSFSQTNDDGSIDKGYCSKLAVEAGWAKWPDLVSGYNQKEAHDYIILNSSSKSGNKFKITVDDNGTISAAKM